MSSTRELVAGGGDGAADEFKRAAREGVSKIRLALEQRAPSKLVKAAASVENSPHVQGLLGTSVPFAACVLVLGLKTVLGLLAPSLGVMVMLDCGLIALHVMLNAPVIAVEQPEKPKFRFSKDAVFEFTHPSPPPTPVVEEPAAAAVKGPAMVKELSATAAKEPTTPAPKEPNPVIQEPTTPAPAVPTTPTPAHKISLRPTTCLPQPGVHKMSFRDADWVQFKVRQPGYSKSKAKAPSKESIYELVRLDLIRDHVVNAGSCLSLPQVAELSPNPSTLPNLFIVNAQIPDKSPSLFGSKNKDDLGFSLVFYLQLKPWAVAEQHTHPGVKLLKRYVAEHAKTPDIRRRFKSIGMVYNVQNLGSLATLVDTYNGKPAILNKTATIFQQSGYFEVDVSVFDFPYIPLKGLSSVKEMVAGLGLRAGFLLQGEDDDELPEVVLGGGEFCLDFASANRL